MTPAFTSPASVTSATRLPSRASAISPRRLIAPGAQMTEGTVLKVKLVIGLAVQLFDRVDLGRIESEVPGDLLDGREGLFVGPDRVSRHDPSRRDGIIGRVALVGAVARLLGPLEEVHLRI